MLKGSCACGRVRYEIAGRLHGPITACHCWRCRKHSGSSFGTTAAVIAAALEGIEGKDLLASWESSPVVGRCSASCCGSPLYRRSDDQPAFLGFRLGTLDTDPGVALDMHFQVGSKVPWLRIDDGLPQQAGGPPFGERE